MRTLYFDCFAGTSGNMILAALLGLGVEKEELEREITRLSLPAVSISSAIVDRSGISALHIEVVAPNQRQHRHLSDIIAIIEAAELSDEIKSRSIKIFTRLALAEAKVHGVTVEKVHFHEVGAIDAIVDIVGACIGFHILGIENFVCSKLNVGSGFVDMDHGTFPVPPPAVVELLNGVPIFSNEIVGELVTPTGAAIISTVCDSYGSFPQMVLERSAYGAGTRSYDGFPNVLRLVLGETIGAIEPPSTDDLMLIETNVDDISAQVLGFVMERAFDLGALDCWFTPIQMKKNRPATMISVLCRREDRTVMTKLLYDETTTLGLRIRSIERECLQREFVSVKTRFGEVDVKIATYNGKITNAMPEYDQVRKLAVEHNVPFRTVHREVLAEIERNSKASAA